MAAILRMQRAYKGRPGRAKEAKTTPDPTTVWISELEKKQKRPGHFGLRPDQRAWMERATGAP